MRSPSLVLLIAVALCSCASAPRDTGSDWRGHSAGKVKVRLHYRSPILPEHGWLVKSSDLNSSGTVRFTKWGTPNYKYQEDAFFVVEEVWRADAEHLGLLQIRDGATEFCTLNPEHGAYLDGDSIVHTRSWDYCARLLRK